MLAESLSLLERKRLELARALATEPKVLLLDEIAGGLTEHEVQSLIETIKQLRAEGISIIWIEHIVHALLAVVDRLIALDFGKLIAEGDPKKSSTAPKFGTCTWGAWLHEPAGTRPHLLPATAISRPSSTSTCASRKGRPTPSSVPTERASPPFFAPSAVSYRTDNDKVRFDGQAIGQLPPHKRVGSGISYVPEGRWVFPSLTVNENLQVGAHSRRTRAPGPWTRSMSCSRCSPG